VDGGEPWSESAHVTRRMEIALTHQRTDKGMPADQNRDWDLLSRCDDNRGSIGVAQNTHNVFCQYYDEHPFGWRCDVLTGKSDKARGRHRVSGTANAGLEQAISGQASVRKQRGECHKEGGAG